MIRHLDTLQNDRHHQASYHLIPYKVGTILLIILLMFYIPLTDLLSHWKFILSGPLSLFQPIRTPPPLRQPSVLCICESISVCFVLQLSPVSEIIQYLWGFLFCVVLFSICLFPFELFLLAQGPRGPPPLSHMAGFHSFQRLSNIPEQVCITISFIHSLTDRCSSCFRILAFGNNAAVSMEVRTPV